MSTYNPSDYKDVKSLGFEVDSAETWSSPPPYQNKPHTPPVSPPASPPPTKRSRVTLRQWVSSRVRSGSSDSYTEPSSPKPSEEDCGRFNSVELMLAPEFRHAGDTVIVAGGMGFQVDSRVLAAASPKFETLIGQQRQAFPNAPLIVVALPYREHEIRALLTVLVPYAISRPLQPMSVEDLSVVATLFDKYAMRPAPRYSLARVVEARAAASLDLTSATQCIEWARLAHAVRSVTALKRVLGLTAPSVLREYWLLSDASIAAIPPHIYRALVLVGNTHCLLGDEGLSSINFKYKEGQLYLTTAEGDVVSN